MVFLINFKTEEMLRLKYCDTYQKHGNNYYKKQFLYVKCITFQVYVKIGCMQIYCLLFNASLC